MKWKPNRDSAKINTEMCVLLVNPNDADYFSSYIKYKTDSTKTSQIVEGKKKGSVEFHLPRNTKHALYDELLIKKPLQQSVTLEKRLYSNLYNVDYKCPQNWKITNTEDKYMDYKVQKATLDFGGRQWEAWFTTEIPIPEGPYKFYGLPGLIVKMKDKTNEYSFELKALKKEVTDISERNFAEQKVINVSPEKWTKLWEAYQKDPSSVMAPSQQSSDGFNRQITIGGNPSDPNFRKKYDKMMWTLFANFKNPIELTPACK